MSKIKIPRKNVSLDMTAMCDVAFLLLTFFMLTTTFKPEEPLIVDTPSSTSEIPMPEKDNILISIGKKGEVFFGLDSPESRIRVLDRVARKYEVKFTAEQKKEFSTLPSHGVAIQELPAFLDMSNAERSKFLKEKKGGGMPCDTVGSPKNELYDWLYATIGEQRRLHYVIKGDGAANYKEVKNVIATVQALNINRFNLITSLERKPSK